MTRIWNLFQFTSFSPPYLCIPAHIALLFLVLVWCARGSCFSNSGANLYNPQEAVGRKMYFFPQVFTWQARTLVLVSGCDPSFISQVLPFLSRFLRFSESLGISLQCVFRFRNQIRREGKRGICHDYRTDHTRPEVGGGVLRGCRLSSKARD